MEKVEVFKTSDGKLFEEEDEARDHEGNLNFQNWYDNIEEPLLTRTESVESADMLNWLLKFKYKVLELYGMDYSTFSTSALKLKNLTTERISISRPHHEGHVEVACDPLGWSINVFDERGSIKSAEDKIFVPFNRLRR